MYKKICVDCELLWRQKWVNEDPHLFSRRQCPEITDGTVDDGGSVIADGTVANDTTAEGWTVVEVSRGSESQSSGVNQSVMVGAVTNQSKVDDAVVGVTLGSESPSPSSEVVVVDDEPEPPKLEWATMGAIRQEMAKFKKGAR